ncbi:MAG: hypothetical protein QF864_07130 [SAR202 cluster bacterium]|nr:hypothetical protein [SAR202 cluster bacterium]
MMVGFSLQVGAFSELDLDKANEGCMHSQGSGCKLSGADMGASKMCQRCVKEKLDTL